MNVQQAPDEQCASIQADATITSDSDPIPVEIAEKAPNDRLADENSPSHEAESIEEVNRSSNYTDIREDGALATTALEGDRDQPTPSMAENSVPEKVLEPEPYIPCRYDITLYSHSPSTIN